MSDQADLAAHLGSRICHDLISPLGAIGNGIELLDLAGIDSPEVALIREAVADANRRVKLFRIAFGLAGADQMVAASEIRQLLANDGSARALRIEWQVEGDVARPALKEALLGLMCLESAMPWGGETLVRQSASGWLLAGAAERLKLDEALWQGLGRAGGGAFSPLPPPAQLHFALLREALQARGARAQVEIGDTEIGLTL